MHREKNEDSSNKEKPFKDSRPDLPFRRDYVISQIDICKRFVARVY